MHKKLQIVLWAASLVCICLTAIVVVRAWYVNQARVGKIDAETKDLSFIYKFDDVDDANVTEKNIYNITFFDIDDKTEIKYAGLQACKITLHLENSTKYAMDYTVTFDTVEYKKYLNDSDEIVTNPEDATGMTLLSDAYVECWVTDNDSFAFASSTDDTLANKYFTEADTNSNSVYDYHEYSGTVSAASGATNGTDTLYLYFIGVQLYDGALNQNFMTDTYTFHLTFNSVSAETDPDVTVPTTTITETTTETITTEE